MDHSEQLATAITLAVTRHQGQFDKGGMPYSLHVLKVMYLTKSEDLEVLMIAVLHDIVEDTDITYQDLHNLGFSKRVIAGIQLLTKVKGQTHDEYVAGILTNTDAILVKMADLRHNSDIRRLKGVTEKDIKRVVKYHNMWILLKATLESGSLGRWIEVDEE